MVSTAGYTNVLSSSPEGLRYMLVPRRPARIIDQRQPQTNGNTASSAIRQAKSTLANSIINSDVVTASMATVHRRIVENSGAHAIAPLTSTSHSPTPTGGGRNAEAFSPASALKYSTAP